MRVILRCTIIILALSFCHGTLFSQTSLRNLGRQEAIRDDIKPGRKRKNQSEYNKPAATKASEDTVFAFQTAKQHGWFLPLGLLTKEQAKHRSLSLMFTGKNDKGHWTKMESIDADGRHVAGAMSPYIAKIGSDLDSLANKDWVNKLQESCIYEFIPDPSGENIIQERAYDKDHNLLYAYSRTPVGANQFIGSYRDIFGLPAEMRNDYRYSYGTLVLITEDEYGNDMRVEYIDSKRRHKPNADGAYAEMFYYDEKGNILTQCSVDSLGNKMKDVWGNCAVIHTYNQDHQSLSAMFADENLAPMRMPLVQSRSRTGVIKVKFEYDKYYRVTAETFFTETDEPDTNVYGCHKIIYEYDDKGRPVAVVGLDKEGNLATMDFTGCAKCLTSYDEKGRPVLNEFYDKNDRYISNPDYLFKIEQKYDVDDRQILYRTWYNDNGIDKIGYWEETIQHDGYKELKTQRIDGTSRINKYDPKGREFYVAHFDESANPIRNDENWSTMTVEYDDSERQVTKFITRYLDVDGSLAQNMDYNYRVTVCDSIACTELWKDYKNHELVNTYRKKYNESFSSLLEQADTNWEGTICRSGGSSDVMYYNSKAKWTPFSKLNYIVGIDEFDEPDYIVPGDGELYYYFRNSRSGAQEMTTENDIIKSSDYAALRDTLPKIITIEIVDSSAYRLGLRDNDVILEYGNYNVDLVNPTTEKQFRVDWAIRNVLDASKIKDMIVFRIEDAKAGKFGLDTIRNLTGTASNIGFIPHVRYLTKKQTKRILSCLSEYKRCQQDDKNNYVVISYPRLYRSNRFTPYMKEIGDVAIYLGGVDKTRNLKYDYRDKDNSSVINKMLTPFSNKKSISQPILNSYFTSDGVSIKDFSCTANYGGLYFWGGFIGNNDYESLKTLFEDAALKINRTLSSVDNIEISKIKGTWMFQINDSVKFPTIGNIQFEEDGKCLGMMTGYSYVPESTIQGNYGSPIFRINRTFQGSWECNGNMISLNCYKKIRDSIECVDIENLRYNLSDVMEYFNEDYNKYRSYYDTKFVPYCGINDEFFIKSINKNQMVIDDGCGNEYTLVKAKINPQTSIPEIKGIAQSEIKGIAQSEIKGVAQSDLIGNWSMTESNLTISMNFMDNQSLYCLLLMDLPLSETGNKIGAFVSLGISGNYEIKDDLAYLKFDESSVVKDFSYMKGEISEDELNEKLSNFDEGLNNGCQDFVKLLIESNLSVSKIIDGVMYIDDMTLNRINDNFDVVVGEITGSEGYFVDLGLTGKFIILDWCDWNCTMDIDAFSKELEKQKDNPKRITLLPVGVDENGNDIFGTPFTLDCPSEKLGIHITSLNVPSIYYLGTIMSRYKIMQ